MKRKKYFLTIMFVCFSFFIQKANADVFTYNLDCVISGGSCADESPLTWGTLTLEDVTNGSYNAVKVSVDLVGGNNKIMSIALNFDDDQFDNSTEFYSSLGLLAVDEDSTKFSGGYKTLDITLLDEKNNQSDPWSDVIYLVGSDLYASDFNFVDVLNGIYGAVHIGNYGDAPGVTGRNSISVGATPAASNPVPEPTTMLLFGAGVAGLAGIVRRKKS